MKTLLLLASASILLIGCASSTPPPAPPPPQDPAPDPDAPPKGSIYGGSLAPVEVKKKLVEKKDEIRACYHALLEKNKKASGKVVLRITVAEDGTVEEVVNMNATTLPDATAACIAEVVKTVTFPKPTGGKARITYPWEFTTE